MVFEAATAEAFNDARPQATSSGNREKSTTQPSRLKQLKSYDEPKKMQSEGHDSVQIPHSKHFV